LAGIRLTLALLGLGIDLLLAASSGIGVAEEPCQLSGHTADEST